MRRRTAVLAFAVLVGTGLFAQAPLALEVASIRVHSFASDDRGGPPIAGNRLTLAGNLNQLIMYAYDLKTYQLSRWTKLGDAPVDRQRLLRHQREGGRRRDADPIARPAVATNLVRG